MAEKSGGGKPGPALTIGVPLIILAAAAFFGYTYLIKPAMEGGDKPTASGDAATSSKKGIKIAGDPWSGYSTFRGEPRLAAKLAKDGLALDYIDDEKLYDQNERMKWLAEGKLDLALTTLDGLTYAAGDAGVAFSLQSITKVITFNLAMNYLGDELWRRVMERLQARAAPRDASARLPGI